MDEFMLSTIGERECLPIRILDLVYPGTGVEGSRWFTRHRTRLLVIVIIRNRAIPIELERQNRPKTVPRTRPASASGGRLSESGHRLRAHVLSNQSALGFRESRS